jgi:hypothetical protein
LANDMPLAAEEPILARFSGHRCRKDRRRSA